MASSDARNLPLKATGLRIPVGPFFNGSGAWITGWTGADSEVSKDAGSFTDCTNEATEIGTSGMGYLELTSTEMNADEVRVKITVTNSGAVPFAWYSATQRAGAYLLADTRELAGQTVTAASGVTFPASVASPTNITAGTITTVTNLTNLPSIPANWLTAAGIASGALDSVWSTASRTLTAGTNIQLPANGLANVTAWAVNITGSVSGSVGSVTAPVTITGDAATAGTRFLTMIEVDGLVYRYTANSLELTPSSGLTEQQVRDSMQLAPTNAGDTQPGSIDAKIDALSSGSGSGAYTITVTVTDGTDPMQNAIVRVTEGINSYTVSTNASGQGAFALDAATYNVAVTKDGYQFTPTTRTVTGNQAGTLTNDLELTETVIPSPASPEMCTVAMNIIDPAGAAVSGLIVTFTLYPANASRADGNVITTRTKTATSNGSGLIQCELVRTDAITPSGAYYQMSVSGSSVKVPQQPIRLTAATFDLGTLIV